MEKFLSSTREDFLNILTSLSTGLEALVDSLALGKLDSSFKKNLSFVLKFTLISNQVNPYILGGMLFNLLQPTSQVVESLISCDIICQEYTVSSLVEDSSDRLEGLLTCLFTYRKQEMGSILRLVPPKADPCFAREVLSLSLIKETEEDFSSIIRYDRAEKLNRINFLVN